MPVLDDYQRLSSADPSNMLQDIRSLADHCTETWAKVRDIQLPPDYSRVDAIVFTGMGGSAMIGDVLASLIGSTSPLPFIVSRGYELPKFVGPRTLVIASSHSGETEETITSFKAAHAAGAKLLGLGTGGSLQALAEQWNAPFLRYDFAGQPRAAFGYAFVTLLGAAYALDLLPDPSAAIEEACALLHELHETIGPDAPTSRNPAKQLALELHGHIPYVYAGPLLAKLAHRWKNQLNENSKSWAGWDVLPELNHNTVASYEFPEVWSQARIILLRSSSEGARMLQRMDITAQLLAQRGIACSIVQAQGESALAQMFWTAHFSDYVSYYLAALYGTNPTEIEAISQLKEQLQRAPEQYSDLAAEVGA
jgi:glucose/mannose-6-phosphate isomerase